MVGRGVTVLPILLILVVLILEAYHYHLPVFTTASDTQFEKCNYRVVSALETEPVRKGFSSSGRGKVRRITKGKSGVKSRRVGMSTDGHIVCESSERELELVGCVPQVGNLVSEWSRAEC